MHKERPYSEWWAQQSVSAASWQIIARIRPIDLLVIEKEKHAQMKRERSNTELRNDIRSKTLAKRYERGAEFQNAREKYFQTKYRRMDCFMNTSLSGDKAFNVYIKWYGTSSNENCICCRPRDTPEHPVVDWIMISRQSMIWWQCRLWKWRTWKLQNTKLQSEHSV